MQVTPSQILQFIAQAPSRVSFPCLLRHFSAASRGKTRALKGLVGGMIRSGALRYTSLFGNSYLEISYDQPTRVSRHVVLKPPMRSWPTAAGQRVISLEAGASFGVGEHPTTRLAIQLIDETLHAPPWKERLSALRAIDIGTGSGVLAIVAAKIGLGLVHAVDTDPCAVFEARHNVRLNEVEDRVDVREGRLEACEGCYDLVIANLRAPTLFGLVGQLKKKLTTGGVLVFSGIKAGESRALGKFYEGVGFFTLKERAEKGWCALCIARGDFQGASAEPIP